MATVILAAAGAALGGSIGGGLAGVSSVAIGRLAGATVGRLIDQSVMGAGSDVVETGKVDRFRLTGSAEGAAQARVFGRARVSGQVIWATRFQETVIRSGGGKGAPTQPKTRSYSYSVSLAIALCEGEILGVGRMWADGVEVGPEDFNLQVYTGSDDQMPDPKMEAVEGAGAVPAYRGTAYVVIEDLALERFGNRVPQFNFEVIKATPEDVPSRASDYSQTVRAVALMPGTGEYALATTPVYLRDGAGRTRAANENTPAGVSDFVASVRSLEDELPNCHAASLIVSWFGDDLRAAECRLRPKVEDTSTDGANMPWHVAGLNREAAGTVPQLDGRPVYGGTPADASVIEAIRHLSSKSKAVTFYPFILMEQMAGNDLPNPWTGDAGQPALPWRGRITLSQAPGWEGSPDGTVEADQEVAAFFGTVTAADFQVGDGVVAYSGPQEWSYRRFILHNAALCAAAGGVDAFCIGSEMRSLTQIRGASGFPAVAALVALAAEVRALLGPDCKIGYAADWSEYFGYHPQDGSGDVYFHLDPLWADSNIDFVGIDNYMPLSDWRDGDAHADRDIADDIHDVGYLASNVAGGEGFDWYYHSEEARVAQIRTPIEDGAHGEPWVFRYKDLRNWWSLPHHNRINGIRQEVPTAWEPMSKPIWFTELGCTAVDKGTNQPNKFLDDKSSESALPHYSNGMRDDLMQQAYLQAVQVHFSDPENNPKSEVYDGVMLDLDRAFVWAWDGRPFPAFPNERGLWSDGANYAKGHWINGRCGNRTLASVVEEICVKSGLRSYDVSGLHGVVRGYVQSEVADARAALQPLMLRHGFDAVERDGALHFTMRGAVSPEALEPEHMAVSEDIDGDWELARMPDAEISGRVRLNFPLAERDFEAAAEEAVLHDEATFAVAQSEVSEVLTRAEARQTVERWLAESRIARDRLKLALPPSRLDLGAGDLVQIAGETAAGDMFRLDRVTHTGAHFLEGTRAEPAVYASADLTDDAPRSSGFVPPVPVQSLFLDLPLLTGDEVAHAPHIAAFGRPWPGSIAVYDSDLDDGYDLNVLLTQSAVVGITETPLPAAHPERLDRGDALYVRLLNGVVQSLSELEMLNGGNLAFIGDGRPDGWEALQFQEATLVGEDRYALSARLRGQLGTESAMRDVWPAGSWLVVMSPAVSQLDVARHTRGLARNYRVGPAARPVSDGTYTHHVKAFAGIGLRPYAPAHLAAKIEHDGDLSLSWIRRSRMDADSWEGLDVPLGEETESYLVRVRRGDRVLREITVSVPAWVYSANEQTADGGITGALIEVAQVSATFGAGVFKQLQF